MKINMIQCDICGKMVDHNDKKIGDMLSNKSFMHDQPCIDRGFYDRFKVNRLTMYGIINRKGIQEFLDKETNDEDAIINIEFDLCEECLFNLYKMISRYIKEAKE